MNCSEVEELLSAYHDRELADDLYARMSSHLAGCSDCARDLAGFEQLSAMASRLATPAPPARIWSEIEKRLDQDNTTVSRRSVISIRLPWAGKPVLRAAMALAAMLVLAVGWFGYERWFEHGRHDHLAVDLSHYMAMFSTDPDAAHRQLVTKYESQPLEPEGAVERLGYRPAVANGLPMGYRRASSHVMRMPCCASVGCLCERSDGTTVAIFEHDEEQPVWFGDRPAISVTCGGKRCSLVQMNGHLAATWKNGRRHITVIGARDVAEVGNLVAWLDQTRPSRPP